MARKDITGNWTRDDRNAINENFRKLFEEYVGAGLDAKEAREKAHDAVMKSDEALALSERTQKELSQAILEGDSSPLGGQLSVGADGTIYSDPQDRLVKEFNSVNQQLAQIAVNVLNFGAKGDGVTDDTQAFNDAINTVYTMGGGDVYVPNPDDFYLILGTIEMKSNVTLRGSKEKPLLYNNSTAARLINVVEVNNVGIDSLTIRNGTSTTGRATQGKDGIWLERASNVTISNNLITETQGQYGIRTERTKNIKVINNDFLKNTYAGCMFMAETEDITVSGNIFDTITSVEYPYTYLMATGNDNIGQGYEYFVKNLRVFNNKFLNNPLWEGIDCHGGENIWIYNNYIENVKQGIMCQVAPGDYVENEVHKNIHIYNNVIIQGNGENGLNGIAVGGSVHLTREKYVRATNINVTGNTIIGFGDSTGSVGGIVLRNSENVVIKENTIENIHTLAINLYVDNKNVCVENNTIKNPRTSNAIGIAIRSTGNSFVDIDKNNIYSDEDKTLFEHGIYFYRPALVNVRDNKIKAQNDFGNTTRSLLNKNFVTNFNTVYGYKGFKGYDPNGIIKFVCTMQDNRIRGVHAGFPDVVSVSGESGSNTLTISSGNNLYHLLEGLEVVIEGAGLNSSDLTTYVVSRTDRTLTIATALQTSVTGAAIESTPATWIEV